MTDFRKFIHNGSIGRNQQFGNAIGDYDHQLSNIFERIKRLRPDDVRNLDPNLRNEFFGFEHPDHIQIALWHDAKKMAQQASTSFGNPVSKSFAGRQSDEERVHFDQSPEVPPGYTLAETPDGDEMVGKYVPGTGPGAQEGLSAAEIRQLIHDMYGRDNWWERLKRSYKNHEPIVVRDIPTDPNRPVHTLGKYVPHLDQIQIAPGYENDPKVLAHEAAHRLLRERLNVSHDRSIESILGDYVSEYWANRGAQELRQNASEYVHGERVDDPNEVLWSALPNRHPPILAHAKNCGIIFHI